MITPIFRVEQDDHYIYVIIRAINIKNIFNCEEMEVFYEGNEFIFYGKPYYLRLQFPNDLKSSDSILDEHKLSTSYDSETNELKIPIPKKHPGEYFKNLDMIGQLLAKPKTRPGRKLVQVLGTKNFDQSQDHDEEEEEEEREFDWTIEQKIPDSINLNLVNDLLSRETYGFANGTSKIIENADSEIVDMLFDIKNPNTKTVCERRKERLKQEKESFNEQHYLADFYENESIIPIIRANAPWDNWMCDVDILSDQDRQRIIDHLPKIEFPKYHILTKRAIMLSLFDILYAYAYELRTNYFEPTVESCWTIRKLSPTLSCFEFWIECENFENDTYDIPVYLMYNHNLPMFMLICCIRRSLVYPLYRHWRLSIKVVYDVINILSKGRTAIFKCLLDIHYIMANSENNQLINDLYLTDYCCWVQQAKQDLFISMAMYLSAICGKITKDQVGLDLLELEKAAQMALEDNQLSKGIKSILNISKKDYLDSDDDDDDDDN